MFLNAFANSEAIPLHLDGAPFSALLVFIFLLRLRHSHIRMDDLPLLFLNHLIKSCQNY